MFQPALVIGHVSQRRQRLGGFPDAGSARDQCRNAPFADGLR
jgi:hypothetical protein